MQNEKRPRAKFQKETSSVCVNHATRGRVFATVFFGNENGAEIKRRGGYRIGRRVYSACARARGTKSISRTRVSALACPAGNTIRTRALRARGKILRVHVPSVTAGGGSRETEGRAKKGRWGFARKVKIYVLDDDPEGSSEKPISRRERRSFRLPRSRRRRATRSGVDILGVGVGVVGSFHVPRTPPRATEGARGRFTRSQGRTLGLPLASAAPRPTSP